MKMHALKKDKETPIPVLCKTFSSTNKSWAVFTKSEGKAVEIKILFNLYQDFKLEPLVYGPDLKPITDFKVFDKEKMFASPYLKGAEHYYARIVLPEHLPAGEYRLGQQNSGSFTVLDVDSEKCVLECPEGFWVAMDGIFYPPKYFFNVPEGKKSVKLFCNRPIEIVRSDGSAATDKDNKVSGELEIPVDGKTGFWFLRSTEHALIRFRNLPPFFSFLTPKRYFVPNGRMPLPAGREISLPEADQKFVSGYFGQGLQLTGKDEFSIARGEKLTDGSYENFPAYKGTIEFWLRPNWSILEKNMTSIRHRFNLIDAGDVRVQYTFLLGKVSQCAANLDLLCGLVW
jgi:hypothetical protein